MSARTARTRLLAATTVALAALALTACDNGQGVRDEGPSSSASKPSTQPGRSSGSTSTGGAGGSTAKPAGNSGTTTGGTTGGTTNGSTGGSTGKTTGGTTGGAGSTTRNTPCTGANTKTTATEVTRPLNHLLLTVTNTGSKNCDLTGYPKARFSEAQAVPPVAEETHPQAVVTLAPGESGYAGVLLSGGDGSGANGYTAKTLTISFDSGSTARAALPAKGVYVDDKLTVTYWQQSLDDALTY
ncbi:DUF4232 domain-containing protein [Streptomyces sp. NPDC058272]|uniref:DUF4232 domain-containing protein n=1 Tax=Streptomyces sp. NPDC058272 TaxID=3346415 RepID=UPI0036E4DFD3